MPDYRQSVDGTGYGCAIARHHRESAVSSNVAAGEAGRARRHIKDVDRDGVVTLDEKDSFAAAGKIGFKETTMTFLATTQRCESQQQAKYQ